MQYLYKISLTKANEPKEVGSIIHSVGSTSTIIVAMDACRLHCSTCIVLRYIASKITPHIIGSNVS